MKPKLKPLSQWYCDVCRLVIDSPEGGMLVFDDRDERVDELFIVHKRRCDDTKKFISSWELSWLVGEEGQVRLLSLIEGSRTPGAYNPAAVVELFRRCQVKYWEEARMCFNHPAVIEELGRFDPTDLSCFFEEHLLHVIHAHP